LSKAEAIVRTVVIGALKGDARSIAVLFRLAEQVIDFDEPPSQITRIELVGIRSQSDLDGNADAG
jgi:hypothetical protein